MKYRNKRGSLNQANRSEEMLAILISMMTAMQTTQMQMPNKFMPYLAPDTFVFKPNEPETDKPIENAPIEAVFGLLKALKKN